MAIVKGSSELLGLRSLAEDIGAHLSLELASDATAAIGMVARLGIGKVRHLAVSDLWVQHIARSRQIAFGKINGAQNAGYLMTKGVDAETMERHLEKMGYQVYEGRPQSAPRRAEVMPQLSEGEPQSAYARKGGDVCVINCKLAILKGKQRFSRADITIHAHFRRKAEGERRDPSPVGSSLTVDSPLEQTIK